MARRGRAGCSLRAPGDPRWSCSMALFPSAHDVLSRPAGATYSFWRPSRNHLRSSCLLSRLPQTCDFASPPALPGPATIMEIPVPRYAPSRHIQQPPTSFSPPRPSPRLPEHGCWPGTPSRVRIRVHTHLSKLSSSVFSPCAAPELSAMSVPLATVDQVLEAVRVHRHRHLYLRNLCTFDMSGNTPHPVGQSSHDRAIQSQASCFGLSGLVLERNANQNALGLQAPR
ncbi:hypothetical protein L227DRAFT_650307 [Lentinus tigrinus ALCF2SS1-6]|uniref:Uncharacterized protein n=1 Tax=Lentinus tigrinus ALCF2SS1-6 TaxID=1328759 RepID=A0A5C2SLR7_9APHY|nr:hypothetical protein L227DRAFT_650307 [Lentinus tigrinus ALCF2SS1-6]